MKIVTVVGARPQFIKISTVSHAIKEYNKSRSDEQEEIIEIIVHTGQHFDKNMSDIFFEQMKMPEHDYFLDINSLSHGAMTGQMLEKIEEVLVKESPDWVLVYGDTNSTIAGALAAKKLHIKVAHVEAGLRSFNMEMPEEINRILTDRISDLLFCPTDTAVKNLENEGFKNSGNSIIKCGDVMYESSIFFNQYSIKPEILNQHKNIPENNFILATIHREENTDDKNRLINIFKALNKISLEYPIVVPLHPRTKKKLNALKNELEIDNNLVFIEPVGYLEMLHLLKNCCLVMTDSGGLQKEAFFFKKMCITLRDETEWVELVEHGVNIIAGADSQSIYDSFKKALLKTPDYNVNLYGEGKTSQVIIDTILSFNR